MALTVLPPESADSYVDTVANAKTIASVLSAITFLGVDSTAFTSATDSVCEAALKMGAGIVDGLRYAGEPVSQTQARQWPRTGTFFAPDVVPEAIKQAQVAAACALMTAPTATQQARADGITSFSFGDKSASLEADHRDPVPMAVLRILRNAGLIGSESLSTVQMIRGSL